MRARTSIEQRLRKSKENTREEVGKQAVVPQKTPNGKMAEVSHIADTNILKAKIPNSKRKLITKRKKKKHKKMNSIENITKNTTSNKASNIRVPVTRRRDLAMTKTATLIVLRKLDSARNLNQRPTQNMNRMRNPCSIS